MVILLQTINCGLRLKDSLPVSHVWDLRFADRSSRLPCLFSFILLLLFLAEKLSPKLRFFEIEFLINIGKRVVKSCIYSQTWNSDVLGCKKPFSRSLTSAAWSSRTNGNLKPQTWRQGPDHMTSWRSRFAGVSLKTSILRWLDPVFLYPPCLNLL